MLASCRMNGFVPTKDPAQARHFYEEVLGLTFVDENPFVVMFRGNQAMVIAQKMSQFVPATYTVLGWEVEDIEDTVSRLTNKGVLFERYPWMEQDEMGIWNSSDGKVAWFKDPDGNILSVSQH